MTHVWTPFVAKSIYKSDVFYVPVIHDANPHPGESTVFSRWLSKESLKHSNGYIVLSSAVEKKLRERKVITTGIPIWKMPHGPLSMGTLGKERYLDKKKEIQILFLGRIHQYKGLDIFIDAMKLLNQNGVNFSARILGEGNIKPFKKNLENLSYITVQNRWISNSEFSHALISADLLVLPYREASQSGVVAAAMASALPVIVTPVGGLSEQVQHGVNGLISANMTADSVAKSIECLLIDNSLYHKISSGALESVNTTYSWKESVLSIKEIWRYLSGKQ